MPTFSVNTLIALFAFIVRQLLKTANSHTEMAQSHQDIIDRASADKNKALQEAKRAATITEKVQALIA